MNNIFFRDENLGFIYRAIIGKLRHRWICHPRTTDSNTRLFGCIFKLQTGASMYATESGFAAFASPRHSVHDEHVPIQRLVQIVCVPPQAL